jgi:hypothetical protein
MWTTAQPATAEVEYGLTTAFGNTSPLQPDLATDHAVQVTGLAPSTTYYFRVIATAGTQRYVSSNFSFVTTNYVTTNQFFGLTNSWKFSTANPYESNWTNPSYDDSTWSGPGQGLLWVDVRAAGPNPSVEPKNTELPPDPNNNGYPYVTYYFRTHFTLATLVQGSSLAFSGYIDDGAVFYLNGAEIYRLRMPASTDAGILATGYPCDGDATCLDEFIVPAESLKSLALGDNVLAVEVHNYNLRSADTTFGVSLSRIEPLARGAKLDIRNSGTAITLSWEGNGFVLQSASTPEGPWTDVGTATASPFTVEPEGSSRYYRLRK